MVTNFPEKPRRRSPVTDAGTLPALDDLDHRANQLLEELRDGFQTLPELLYWTHDFTTISLGTVPDSVLIGMESDPTLQKAMLDVLDDDDDDDRAAFARRLYEKHIFTRYYQSGYKVLKTSANQYVGAEDLSTEDADSPIGFRPALEEIQERQRRSLESLVDGFESLDALSDWRHDLVAATYGTVDRSLLRGLAREKPLIRMMAHPGMDDSATLTRKGAKLGRLRFGFVTLMPEFAKGIREMAGTSVEALPKEADKDFVASPNV